MFVAYWVIHVFRSKTDEVDRRNIKRLLIIGMFSRLAILLVAYVANSTFGLRTPFEGEVLPDYNLPLLNLFARWDSGYYLLIAQDGYTTLDRWAFRPLFPMIMASLRFIFTAGSSTALSDLILVGFFLNNALFLLSLPLFYKLASMFLERNKALMASILFAFYPTTFFMSSIYPEALCMVLILIGYLYLEEGKIITSSIFVFLAGLSRPEVFMLAIVYLVKGALEKKSVARFLTASFLSFLSLPCVMIYSFLLTGDILTPFKASMLWPRTGMLEMILNINSLQLNFNPGLSLIYFVLYLPIFVTLLVIVSYYYIHPIISNVPDFEFHRKIFPYVLHSTLFFGCISIQEPYLSLARLSLSTFPLLWVLSVLCGKKSLFFIVILMNITLLMIYLLLHVNWYHVN